MTFNCMECSILVETSQNGEDSIERGEIEVDTVVQCCHCIVPSLSSSSLEMVRPWCASAVLGVQFALPSFPPNRYDFYRIPASDSG